MRIRPFERHAPRIHPTAYIDESAVIIGDVEIGEDSSVWPLCVVRGDIQSIRIGARTSIQGLLASATTFDTPTSPS